jgi:hypothetical protein
MQKGIGMSESSAGGGSLIHHQWRCGEKETEGFAERSTRRRKERKEMDNRYGSIVRLSVHSFFFACDTSTLNTNARSRKRVVATRAHALE